MVSEKKSSTREDDHLLPQKKDNVPRNSKEKSVKKTTAKKSNSSFSNSEFSESNESSLVVPVSENSKTFRKHSALSKKDGELKNSEQNNSELCGEKSSEDVDPYDKLFWYEQPRKPSAGTSFRSGVRDSYALEDDKNRRRSSFQGSSAFGKGVFDSSADEDDSFETDWKNHFKKPELCSSDSVDFDNDSDRNFAGSVDFNRPEKSRCPNKSEDCDAIISGKIETTDNLLSNGGLNEDRLGSSSRNIADDVSDQGVRNKTDRKNNADNTSNENNIDSSDDINNPNSVNNSDNVNKSDDINNLDGVNDSKNINNPNNMNDSNNITNSDSPENVYSRRNSRRNEERNQSEENGFRNRSASYWDIRTGNPVFFSDNENWTDHQGSYSRFDQGSRNYRKNSRFESWSDSDSMDSSISEERSEQSSDNCLPSDYRHSNNNRLINNRLNNGRFSNDRSNNGRSNFSRSNYGRQFDRSNYDRNGDCRQTENGDARRSDNFGRTENQNRNNYNNYGRSGRDYSGMNGGRNANSSYRGDGSGYNNGYNRQGNGGGYGRRDFNRSQEEQLEPVSGAKGRYGEPLSLAEELAMEKSQGQTGVDYDLCFAKLKAEGDSSYLTELEKLSPQELVAEARRQNIDILEEEKRQSIIFALLKAQIKKNGLMFGEGTLEILPDEFGFLRRSEYQYLSCPDDIYISPSQIRRFGLRNGSIVSGQIRPPKEKERYFALLRVEAINHEDPNLMVNKPYFDDLTAMHPNERIIMETTPDETDMRILDLVVPVGFGQRGLIVSPPRAGKTILLQKMAKAVLANYPDCYVFMLLVDERPEEVTDMERQVRSERCEVISSTFDEPASRHIQVSEIVLEKARRMVEYGKNVVIFLDSITRLARAWNAEQPNSGRTLTGGVDANALQRPKKFFGSARKVEEGGSLTIIATALVDTGSRMDDVIFEEFKGTGNLEVWLDRTLVDKRIWPAVDIAKSGTRREEMIMDPEEYKRISLLRRTLSDMNSPDAMEFLLEKMNRFKTNAEFLMSLKMS